MALFSNGKPEEFLLFIRNLNMDLEDSLTLEPAAKVQYLGTFVCGKALRNFD